MLERIRDGFQGVVKKISGQHHISEKNVTDALDTLKDALLEADVNVRVVRRFINQTLDEALGEKVLHSVSPSQMFIKLLNDKLCKFLGEEQKEIHLAGNPAVILMCGLQGSGKTTTTAKLASFYIQKGKSVMMAAADITRPAAVEQLMTLGAQIQCDVFSLDNARSPLDVAIAAQKKAKLEQKDILIIDTAGRTELDEGLLEEISQIDKKISICERILVVDAMTGQTAVQVAKRFHDAVGITGLIMSKADSDARGGALLSVKSIVNVPIYFLGTGEHIDGLELFYPDRMAQRMLGMGDIVSLVEKVKDQVDEKEAEKLHKKILKKTFTLQDYLEQFKQLSNMGSLEKIAEMLPGVTSEQVNQIDIKQIKREEAIILSMTMREREHAKLIGPTRRARIAKGSGVSVAQVHMLLKKFDKTVNLMKKTMKNKKYQAQLMGNIEGLEF